MAVDKRKSQTGGALVVGLLMLLVMTMTGVAAMHVTSLEERMAGNARDRSLAFQAAEAALRGGESCVSATNFNANECDSCTAALYRAADSEPTPTTSLFSSSGAVGYKIKDANKSCTDSKNVLRGVSVSPSYYVKELNYACPVGAGLEAGVASEYCYYSITAQGTAGAQGATVWLRATYKR
ncbi:MAG: PilX N-terminal domain-containing pilus assembly protein [Methylotetracoccus sp.]